MSHELDWLRLPSVRRTGLVAVAGLLAQFQAQADRKAVGLRVSQSLLHLDTRCNPDAVSAVAGSG